MRRSRGAERRAAKWVNLRVGAAMRVSDWLCIDLSKLSRNASEGHGDEFNSPREGGRERGRHIRRRRGVDQGRSRAAPFFFQQQQQQQPHGDGLPCGEDEEGTIKRKTNSQGGGSSTPSPKNQREMSR